MRPTPWAAWRAAITNLVERLYAAEDARLLLERRYLAGTPTLFPDLAANWLRVREQAERLVGLGELLGPTAGGVDGARPRRSRPSRRPEIDLRQLRAAARDRAPEAAASLVESARVAALDVLGDTAGPAAIAARWLCHEHGT